MSSALSRSSERSEPASQRPSPKLDAHTLKERIQQETQKSLILRHQIRPEFERELVHSRVKLALQVFEARIANLYKEYAKSQIYAQQALAGGRQQSQAQYELECTLESARTQLELLENKIESEPNCAVRNSIILQHRELQAEIEGLRGEIFKTLEDVEKNYLFQIEFNLLEFHNKYHIFTMPTFFPPFSTMLNPVRSVSNIVVPEGSRFILLRAIYEREGQFSIYSAFDIQRCQMCNLQLFWLIQDGYPLKSAAQKGFQAQVQAHFVMRRGEADLLQKQIGSHNICELFMRLPEFDCFFLDDLIKIRALQSRLQKFQQQDLLIVVLQLAEGLRALHSEKLSYKYVAPQNVAFCDGVWKFLPPLYCVSGADNILPHIVTEPYRISEEASGARADVHLLGVLMYNMLMGDVDRLYKLPSNVSTLSVIKQHIAEAGSPVYIVQADVFELLYWMVDAEEQRSDINKCIKTLDQLLRREMRKMK